MKKLIYLIVTVIITNVSNAQTVDQILAKIQQNERVSSTKSVVKQTITTSRGANRTLEMVSFTKDFNKSQLCVYNSPARIKGDKILMINDGDDIWFYTPKTDRVRHLASHAKKQKVQGSDFSYEDYENWDYKKDFKTKLLGKEKVGIKNCFKLELTPTQTGPHYSKMIIWADVETYAVVKSDYYEEGSLLKTLECKEIKKIGNHWMATKMIMTNKQDGGKTIMETVDIQADIDLKAGVFTTNNLKKR